MVFARNSGMTSTTDEEQDEAVHKQDVSVFPLATPLIAGPGAIGATMLLVFGVLLSALAVQFMFNGIKDSGLFG